MVGAASWIACGSTPRVPDQLAPPISEGHESMLALTEEAVARFVEEAVEAKHSVKSGRSGPGLQSELDRLERACRDMRREEYVATVSGRSGLKAVPLRADRLALPPAGSAGTFDLAPHLSPAVRRAFLDPETLFKFGDAPRAHPGRWSDEWKRLLERLDEAGMLQLAPRSLVPGGPLGEDLTAGVFAVAKDEHEDRSILNRAPRNAHEKRVDGVTPTFPHGTLFEDIELQPGEELRVSADDLPNYYHSCAITRERALTNSFGPVLRPKSVAGLAAWAALSPDERDEAVAADEVLSLWGVLPMGDGNAVSFAQEGHVNLLRRGGAMRDEDLLVFRRPPPLTGVFEGVMVDDHVVAAVVPRGASGVEAQEELDRVVRAGAGAAAAARGDVGVLARSELAYAAEGLTPKASKRVRFATGRTDVWGATVDGRVGVSRGKTSVLWRAIFVSLGVLRLRRSTGSLWRQLLGLWTHVLTFARVGFAFLGRCFAWEFATDRTVQRMPGAVADELRVLLLFAPTFERDLRAEWSATIACTDASSRWGASVTAPIDAQTSRALWAHRERRGGYIRVADSLEAAAVYAEDVGATRDAEILRRVVGEGIVRAKGEAVNPWLEELVGALPWELQAVFRNRESDHINISEAKAYVAEVFRASLDPREHRKRRFYSLDSFVVVGAGSKGRGSTRRLNLPLRAAAPTLLMTRVTPGFGHLRSAYNPADDPTRGVRLRGIGEEPPWAEAVRRDGVAALEAAYPQLAARRRTPAGLWRGDDFAPRPELTDGEARVPGPPRRDANRAVRAARRAASAPEGVRQRPVSRRRLVQRSVIRGEFEEYLAAQGTSFDELLGGDVDGASAAAADFGAHLFRTGGTRGEYAALVSEIAARRRAWRGQLGEAWDVVAAWDVREPGGSRTPLPLTGFRAAIGLCLLWGWSEFALFLAMTWAGTLRPGESLHLRREHVVLPLDLVSERRVVFLRLDGTKTGGNRVRGAGRSQHARVDDDELISWLELECEGLRDRSFVISLTRAQVEHRFRAVFGALGFELGAPHGLTPASIRAGGATELYVETGSYEAVRRALRHVPQSRSTERYVQEAGAALTFARVPAERRALVGALARLAPVLVLRHLRRLRARA